VMPDGEEDKTVFVFFQNGFIGCGVAHGFVF